LIAARTVLPAALRAPMNHGFLPFSSSQKSIASLETREQKLEIGNSAGSVILSEAKDPCSWPWIRGYEQLQRFFASLRMTAQCLKFEFPISIF
jgi:hypothetical protein